SDRERAVRICANRGTSLRALIVIGSATAISLQSDMAIGYSVTGGSPQTAFVDFQCSIGATLTLTIEGNESAVDATRAQDADGCDAAGPKGVANTIMTNSALGGDAPAVNDVQFGTVNSNCTAVPTQGDCCVVNATDGEVVGTLTAVV